MKHSRKHRGDQRIEVPTGKLKTDSPPATLWLTASYARDWYSDALREAGQPGRSSRRREILFAVCSVESYLFEWVRDTVLKSDFAAVTRYFPIGTKRGVIQKLKDVPKQLAKAGLTKGALDCGCAEFQNFQRLVDFRDGLVHASASRPETSGHAREERPVPSMAEMQALRADWAAAVVRALLQKLHTDTGTAPPPWL